MTPDTFQWQGRVDTDEPGISARWHQHVQAFSPASQGGATLIGFAVDEGVRRNLGRIGAAEGPLALRQALGNLPVLGEPAIFDLGDVNCLHQTLEAAQTELATQVASVLQQRSFPVIMGGGHEVAWGTFQGIQQACPALKRLLIINLDAHFDLRIAAQANSGTPFRQMQQWCEANQKPFDYRVLGISRFSNTQALFDRAEALGVRYWLDEALQSDAGVQLAQQTLAADIDACDAAYLTICLDVLPGGVAPGVSAPAAFGVPLANIERILDQVAGSGKLIAVDMAELNPVLDRDALTAKVAARLTARLIRHCR